MESPQELLVGSIEAIVFTEPDNGFTVARLKEPKKRELTVIVGYLPSLQPGEEVSCRGVWKFHPSHGKQFEVQDYTVQMPSDVVGIQKYLESGLVKGIGPVFAKKIVDHFGKNTLDVIDETPDQLLQVEGIGEKKVEKIISCWKVQKAIREVMVFLRGHGVSPGYAQRIYKTYGDSSIAKVRENPYNLARDVFGIGFKMADAVALKLGFTLYSPERIRAGIEFVLWELTQEGHTCYPTETFPALAEKILEVPLEAIVREMEALQAKERLVLEGGFVWLGPFFGFEKGIADHFHRLSTSLPILRSIDVQRAVLWAEEKLAISFAWQQKEAIFQALSQKVHIITGGPGTGKSTITNAILRVAEKLSTKILLAAPTGRAAKRMSEITRRKAFTIHALLEMDFVSGGFKRNGDNPLDTEFLIVDEASMIDTPLLFYLLRAIPSNAKVLFLGDIDQLPSVGPGNVLRDILQSNTVGVSRLTEIFRQAKGSKIITNAHKINEGMFPSLVTPVDSDFHFTEAETPEAILQVILELITQEIPHRWHFDRIEEIQVLSPMKKGGIGIEMLNENLQRILNPSVSPLFRVGSRFHVGDKVMQLRNNYTKKVYNGDIGRISTIDREEQRVTILFDGNMVDYEFGELDEIVLAYATSVHKYQGSECPCIVMPIHTSHFKLLQRNLLYTAVTRGKKQVYLVGSKKAIALAIQNNAVELRHTGLLRALQKRYSIAMSPG